MVIREEVLRRVLVGKHLLATAMGQLTPQSDATAVAKSILTSHDAAELAIAAIAGHLGTPGLTDRLALVEYADRIEKHTEKAGALPGATFLKQLNTVRRSFKHEGILPDVKTWYRVVENTWGWVDEWCRKYLGTDLEAIDQDVLLENKAVRDLYREARTLRAKGAYRECLEALGQAAYLVLDAFSGIRFPILGEANVNHALMLSAYGVRPSDFLALQRYLPSVREDSKTRILMIKWSTRKTGHPGNWTDQSCGFCLETFLDIALKIQHAPWHPEPVDFLSVFDDVIRAKVDGVELYRLKVEGAFPFAKVVGKDLIRRLKKDEEVRGLLWPVEKPAEGLGKIFAERTTIETADELNLFSESIPGGPVYVEAKLVEIAYAPKEEDFVKKYYAHLFRSD